MLIRGTGRACTRGFNDGWERGYPLMLLLSARQVSDGDDIR